MLLEQSWDGFNAAFGPGVFQCGLLAQGRESVVMALGG